MKYLLFIPLITLTACADITGSRTQDVVIRSDPTGARCTITRAGVEVAHTITPIKETIRKTADDITISCAAGKKHGYAVLKSGFAPAVYGNILLGGYVGIDHDESTGAAYEYDQDEVMITLK